MSLQSGDCMHELTPEERARAEDRYGDCPVACLAKADLIANERAVGLPLGRIDADELEAA